jgi:hypothetical protein
MSASELLSQIIASHAAVSNNKALYGARFSPDFNPWDFVDFDELKISKILAWLLTPSQTHGQGGLFLKLFLGRLGLRWPDETIADAAVIVEAPAHGERRRRIDVLVASDGRAVGIENKLWGAGDQEDQVRDYLEHLDKEAPCDASRCLIYLIIDGSGPTEGCISGEDFKRHTSSKRLRCWGFEGDLVEWLRSCRAASESARVGAFIEELSRKLSKELR